MDLQTACGEFLRVEQMLELLTAQLGVLQRHIDDRSLFAVGLLGNLRGLEVADQRVERGNQNRVALQRLPELRLVDLEAAGSSYVLFVFKLYNSI